MLDLGLQDLESGDLPMSEGVHNTSDGEQRTYEEDSHLEKTVEMPESSTSITQKPALSAKRGPIGGPIFGRQWRAPAAANECSTHPNPHPSTQLQCQRIDAVPNRLTYYRSRGTGGGPLGQSIEATSSRSPRRPSSKKAVFQQTLARAIHSLLGAVSLKAPPARLPVCKRALAVLAHQLIEKAGRCD